MTIPESILYQGLKNIRYLDVNPPMPIAVTRAIVAGGYFLAYWLLSGSTLLTMESIEKFAELFKVEES